MASPSDRERDLVRQALAAVGVNAAHFPAHALDCLRRGGYDTAATMRAATREGLGSCSLPPAYQDLLLSQLQRSQQALPAAPAAGGAAEQEQEQGPAGHLQLCKRVKIEEAPSTLCPHRAEDLGLLPQAGYSDSCVAFYCGRERAVGLHTALPLLLQAPEFGLVYDAAWGAAGCVAPQPRHFQAATELINTMALVYGSDAQRRDAFLRWIATHFPALQMTVPYSSSSSSTAEDDADAAGTILLQAGSSAYCIALLQAKQDGGDAIFQALGHVQELYKGGSCWAQDPVLRASGGPLLLLELLGTCLTLHAAFTVEGNVMAAEPLTPRLLLLPLHGRQEQPGLQLARVLAGLEAGLLLLKQRMGAMAAGRQPGPQQLPLQLEMSSDYKAALGRAMEYATLLGEDAARAAARPGVLGLPAAEGGPARWARLPYPLLSSCFATAAAEQVERHSERPLLVCDQKLQGGAEGRRVLVKLSVREYPVEVHRALAALDLTPQLIDAVRLPGGWYMVVQEYLGQGWKPCSRLSTEQRARVHPLVAAAMQAMHTAQVDGTAPPGV